jgi:Helix-turn-helix domain
MHSLPAGSVPIDEYVIDTLMRDLVAHDRRPAAFLVYLWLAARETRTASPVQLSYQEIAESIGISKSSAQSAIGWLIRRKLLTAAKENATATPVYKIATPWRDRARSAARRSSR